MPKAIISYSTTRPQKVIDVHTFIHILTGARFVSLTYLFVSVFTDSIDTDAAKTARRCVVVYTEMLFLRIGL